jgi:hypothetical protein
MWQRRNEMDAKLGQEADYWVVQLNKMYSEQAVRLDHKDCADISKCIYELVKAVNYLNLDTIMPSRIIEWVQLEDIKEKGADNLVCKRCRKVNAICSCAQEMAEDILNSHFRRHVVLQ